MPMGLTNSPATFQRTVDKVFRGMQGKEIFLFLDDAVIYGKTIEEHNYKFEKFLQRLREANLKLQPDKCEFLKKEVVYLGHLLSNDGVKPDPKKLEAVDKFPVPKTVKNIRQFLGLAGYYRRFIKDFSGIAKPLSNLLKNEVPFIWDDKTEEAFNILKNKLCSKPVLQFPDFTQPFVVTTDASGVAIGGILSQGEIGKDRPVGYVSRVLSEVEQRYDTYSREALAIYYTVTQFRPYLLGKKFTVVTDHKPLLWFKNSTDPTSRVSRWRIKLNAYEYDIMYKAGKMNVNADALSRNPVEATVLTLEEGGRLTRTRAGKISRPNYRDKRPKKPNVAKGARQTDDSVLQQTEQVAENNAEELTENFDDNIVTEIDNNNDDFSMEPRDSSNQEGIVDDIEITGKSENKSKLFVNCKEQLYMRKDNYLYFVTTEGLPCENGAQLLYERKELPLFTDVKPGEVKINNRNNKFQIAIIVRGKQSISTTEVMLNITAGIKVLKSLILKENLRSISMARSQTIENILWEEFLKKMRNILKGVQVKIIICEGFIKYIEEKDRSRILEEMHDSAVGGHKGVTKTYKRIKQRYYWENLKEDTQNYIRKCLQCQLKKLVRVKTKQRMTITDTPHTAMEKVSLDIVGPFPVSAKGFNNILTIQCNFTKYCLAIPLCDATAESVADALIKRFICIFGSPLVILTDQGRNFMSGVLRRIAKKFKIKQVRTTAYHPQSNGSLERSHHTLAEYLKTIIDKNNTWDECLELATLCYNTVPHEGHQFTPYELVFGRLARLPSSEPLEDDEFPLTYNAYVTEFSTRLNNIQKIAREKLIESKIKAKYYYDRKTNHKDFRIGDSVWLLKGGKQYKLGNQYEGPYTVIDIINNNGNIKIKMKDNKTKVVHANRLRISYIDPSN